jgi:pimeloyl-ACP methyl ester carboxylesterase
VPHKHFTIDGIATFVHHLGPTTLPDVVPDLSLGELVLCLHGAGGSGGAFAPLLEKLAARHSPLAFDQPGHGRSGGLDSLGSIERMRDFLRAFVEKLALRRPVLLGHSMGGAVALAYALAHPGEVRALVLVGSGARGKIPEALIAALRQVVAGKARREFTRDAFSPATSPEVVRQGIMEDLKTDPRVGLGDLLALQGWSALERLGELRVPTLVAVGEDELERIRAGSDALASGIPGARKVVIPKAGHMLPLEQPQALAESIDDFLAGLAR